MPQRPTGREDEKKKALIRSSQSGTEGLPGANEYERLESECLGINRGTVQRVGDFGTPLLLVSLLTHSSDKVYKRAKANVLH